MRRPYPMAGDLQARTASRLTGNPARLRRNPTDAKSQRVIAMLEPSRLSTPRIDSPIDIVHVLDDYIKGRAHEMFIVLHLNGEGQVVSHSEFTEGHVGRVSISMSGVFREAIVAGAEAVITAHQHPNSRCMPSSADRNTWALMVMLGEALQIPVVDNMVLGSDGMFSESLEAQMGRGEMTWAQIGIRRGS